MTRIISLAPLSVLELSPADMVTCAAQAGYTHLGLRLSPVLPQHPLAHPIVGEPTVIREVLARVKDTGVHIHDVEFVRLAPDTQINEYLPMLETGAKLGAKHVLAGGNDADEQRLTERFGELCDAAASFGLSANIEPIPMLELGTLAQARRMLDKAARPNAGIVIDPLHFDRARETFDEIARIPREWLRFMQFCDAPAERPANIEGLMFQARYERKVPGEGGIDLLGLLRALPRDLPIGIEVPQTELSRTLGAVERARRLREATQALLERLDHE